ncbi:MAG TPA: sulfatase, partial [Candidatus Kryptonia bacterium]|nr:sulfatase [Candidatus Kryptonia bacterium]
VLTGMNARHHGAGRITNRRDPLGRSGLPAGAWTLATALHERGYRTHAIVTNPYLALRYGLGEGFEGYENVTIESEAFLAFGQTTAVRLLTWLRPELLVGDRGATVSARARYWLASAGRAAQSRFFLWIHYVDPHPPYSRADANRHKSFRSDSLFAPRGGDAPIRLTSPDVARLRSGEIRLSREQKEAVHELYRAEIASVDAAVGNVLQAVRDAGLRDQTLIICVADHGEEFWDHGGVEHGHTLYDELLHVPLMLRWPGRLPAGAHVAALVRVTDVAPTILDLAGIAVPPAGLDGESLLSLINGHETVPRFALSENLLFAEERVALRTLNRKYVRWENGKEEVYDLTQDPTEQRDLAGSATAVEPLRQLYAAVNTNASAGAARGTQPTLDAQAAAALRSLGYLQ